MPALLASQASELRSDLAQKGVSTARHIQVSVIGLGLSSVVEYFPHIHMAVDLIPSMEGKKNSKISVVLLDASLIA